MLVVPRFACFSSTGGIEDFTWIAKVMLLNKDLDVLSLQICGAFFFLHWTVDSQL